jgi:Pyridoxamine 5'-phosphate oxidase
MVEPPRDREARRRDTLARLEHDVDVWVATVNPADGSPHLVPLSFLWNGATLLVSTAVASPTGRSLASGGRVRLGLGPTRDVTLIDGTAALEEELTTEEGEAFAAKTGFDPRGLPGYAFFRLPPVRVQAWREENELAGRVLMRDGRWL